MSLHSTGRSYERKKKHLFSSNYNQMSRRKFFLILNFKLQFISSSPPFVLFFFVFTWEARDFTNQPIKSKNSNLILKTDVDIFRVLLLFVFTELLVSSFFQLLFAQMCYPFLCIFKNFQSLAKCCTSLNKFNT